MHRGPALFQLFLFCSIANGQHGAPAAAPAQGPAIQVIEGDGAINSIRLRRGHDPVVRVVTATGTPVPGAEVTFLLPSTGPSGSFADSGLSLTVATDGRGIAMGRGLRPNTIAGQFRIRVTTSWQGAPAVASITQTNAEPVTRSSRSKKIVIIAVIAGAAIGGVAAAAGHSSGSSSSSSAGASTSGSITSGTPVIGPPR